MIDKKSHIDIMSRLDRIQARKLLSEFFRMDPDEVYFSRHAIDQMQKRNLKTTDVVNVLRAGKIQHEPDFEKGSWRYRVQTTKMTVVFSFRSPDKIIIVTAWRNE